MTDYIRRDEALSFPFANGKYDHKNANEHFIFGCESYREWLENLPTADVRENVHGEWVKDVAYYDEEGCPCIISRCNQCGEVSEEYKFCPHCGAVMDGGVEP